MGPGYMGLEHVCLALLIPASLHLSLLRFLSMLEEEIYGESSPIWEADFTMPATEGAPLVARPGTSVF